MMVSECLRGGLAPWQIRKLTTFVDENLDRTITTRCMADLARLSAFHFCRAFRDSFGDSPHGYVIRRRMERAQGLMLTTNATLGQIAADCGLADQAHFNKLFRKFAGESPGAWRRAQISGRLQIHGQRQLDSPGLGQDQVVGPGLAAD